MRNGFWSFWDGKKVSLYAYKLYEAAEIKSAFIKNALIDKVQEWDAKWHSKQSKVSRLHVEWNSVLRTSPCSRMNFKMGIYLLLESGTI
jgi:hypothetical protein